MTKPDLKTRLRSETGQSATEFALVLPALALVLFAIIQFGLVFKDYLALTDAARAGSRKAAVSRHDPNRVGTVQAAVRSAGADLDGTKLSVQVVSSWEPGEDVTVTAAYPYAIDLFGKVVSSGSLKTEIKERVE